MQKKKKKTEQQEVEKNLNIKCSRIILKNRTVQFFSFFFLL